MRTNRLRAAARAAACLILPAATARAGPLDAITLRDALDDDRGPGVLDPGDVDVGSLRPAVPREGPKGSAYVSIGGFAGTRDSGRREVGGMVTVGVPLDRVAAKQATLPPKLPMPAGSGSGSGSGPGSGSGSGSGSTSPSPSGPAGPVSPSAAALPPRAPVNTAVVVTPAAARACVRAAWRAASVAEDDAAIDSLAARARASAALPELRLRAIRTADQSLRLAPADAETYRATESGATGQWLEARATWRLDRAIFADEEVSIERVRLERVEMRARIAGKALDALFEWQRAWALARDPGLSDAEHFAALLRLVETEAVLEVLTAGWFGRWRAERVGPPPAAGPDADGAAAARGEGP